MGLTSFESKLQSILSQEWIYRGEGNANVVLSLPKAHQVLRIQKCDKPKTILEWFFGWLIQIFKWDNKKHMNDERRNLDFYNLVMIPLLGKGYTCPATNIRTFKNEIQKLDKELLPFRPERRKHKCLQYGTATLLMDYAFLPKDLDCISATTPTYAVEIKPKPGWIPVMDRNFGKCRYCFSQYLKLQNLRIKELSSYCPLDLFSGDKKRMTQALNALIINPQNNFRVFKDGIYCYGENFSVQTFYNMLYEIFQPKETSINSLIDNFCDLIEQTVLKNFYETNGCENCDYKINPLPHETTYFNDKEKHTNGCKFIEPNLPLGCVLERILSLQKLNRLGQNKHYDIYKALIRNKCKFDDFSFVEKLLWEINNNKMLCPKCIIMKHAKKIENITKNEEATLNDLDLIPYLIAAIANDCSFMITFKRVNRHEVKLNNFMLNVDNSSFLVNIGIFDLYPKPLSIVDKHIKRNAKVQKAYLSKQQS